MYIKSTIYTWFSKPDHILLFGFKLPKNPKQKNPGKIPTWSARRTLGASSRPSGFSGGSCRNHDTTRHRFDASEIPRPRPTTGWIVLKPCKSWDFNYQLFTSTTVSWRIPEPSTVSIAININRYEYTVTTKRTIKKDNSHNTKERERWTSEQETLKSI